MGGGGMWGVGRERPSCNNLIKNPSQRPVLPS